jgi:putative pyruvate formate lyase activating enzyme
MATKSTTWRAAYLQLSQRELVERAERALVHLDRCVMCGRRCGVDRRHGATGACRLGRAARVSSHGPHFGEEAPLVGRHGSGTIFFSYCNLNCVFCQNWEISQAGAGHALSARQLAAMMLDLQERGCHNINLVSPSHQLAPILQALVPAVEEGLRLPLVYNSGGYDSPEALALLDGLVDIYLPDMKFADSNVARFWLKVDDYAEVNRAAVLEMYRQVGDLQLDEQDIARRGLLIRHLILPQNLAGTEQILHFVAEQLSPETWVNLMDQYRPAHQAHRHPPLDRRPDRRELRQARQLAQQAGLRNVIG